MKKRTFLRVTSIAAAGSLIIPMGCQSESKNASTQSDSKETASVFELPDLPYTFDALEPNIDARTMEIHYSKHHAGYVRKFNAALEKSGKYAGKTIEDVLAGLGEDDTGLRNNGGGHYNHSLFWDMMSPKKTEPKGDFLSVLNSAFGSFDGFKEKFASTAKSHFGSGWAWVGMDQNKKPVVFSLPNQDNPLMANVVDKTYYPLFGLDVWEHAYYLKYKNMRGDYVDNFFNLINWEAVTDRFMAQVTGR